MKEKQEHIYFVAGSSREEVENSPFVERLLRKGYEVLYLINPVDEYALQNLPEFEGKKFQVSHSLGRFHLCVQDVTYNLGSMQEGKNCVV